MMARTVCIKLYDWETGEKINFDFFRTDICKVVWSSMTL